MEHTHLHTLILCKRRIIMVLLSDVIHRNSRLVENQPVILIRLHISRPAAAPDSTSWPLSAGKTLVPVSPKCWTSIYCWASQTPHLFSPDASSSTSQHIQGILFRFMKPLGKVFCWLPRINEKRWKVNKAAEFIRLFKCFANVSSNFGHGSCCASCFGGYQNKWLAILPKHKGWEDWQKFSA